VEAKYLIECARLPALRAFLAPFCAPDPYAEGDPPEYTVTTMMFDGPSMPLYTAKMHEAASRFKLRVRYYGDEPDETLYLEVKKKIGGHIAKSRARIPLCRWPGDLLTSRTLSVDFETPDEEFQFLEFVRLYRQLGLHPTVLLRYRRESHIGRDEDYARVTFDRKLRYRPARGLGDLGGNTWYPMDSPWCQGQQSSHSCIVVELKSVGAPPPWMRRLIDTFGLVRAGHSKYATAVTRELRYRGGLSLGPAALDAVRV
jgi:hypothetical protein